MKSTFALSTVLSLWASLRSLAMARWFSLTSFLLFFCSLKSLARWSRSRKSISKPPNPRSNLEPEQEKRTLVRGLNYNLKIVKGVLNQLTIKSRIFYIQRHFRINKHPHKETLISYLSDKSFNVSGTMSHWSSHLSRKRNKEILNKTQVILYHLCLEVWVFG